MESMLAKSNLHIQQIQSNISSVIVIVLLPEVCWPLVIILLAQFLVSTTSHRKISSGGR